MTPERWKRVDQLFQDAVTLAPGERAAWLEQACADDADLLQEVREMLASDAAGYVSPEHVRLAAAAMASDATLGGGVTRTSIIRRAGPYRLTRELGRGGMGAVYLGERDDGQYEAEVAVKLIRAGLATEFFLQRFKRERQALARLQHPNIARIFDSGTTEDGLPYIVMELVQGLPITKYVKSKNLGLDQILSLYLEVCRAVSYAHRKLVVHRDLKPANILVCEDGTPKLLDFGICKLLEDAPGDTTATATGTRLMTPEYASPEQIRGDAVTVTSDIYSLGAVLYELLTGRPPHIVTVPTPAALVAVYEEPVPAPSRVAKDPARGAEIAGLLDKVLLKALEKDSQRRYQTVELLAEDLRRVLNRETALAPTNPVASPAVAHRRWWLMPAALLLIVALVAGAAAWIRWQRSELQARVTQSTEVTRQAQKLWLLQTPASVAEARSLAETAVRLYPDNAAAHTLLAQIYNAMLMWFGAPDLKELEAKVTEEAQTAIRLAPQSERAWTTLIGVTLGKELDLPRAVLACREGLAVLPHSVSIMASCSRMHSLAGNSEIALMLARQMESAQPDGPDKWVQLANIYFRLGRVDDALRNCAKVKTGQYQKTGSILISALITANTGRPQEALKMMKALDTDENRRWSYFVWGMIYIAARNGDEQTVAELLERDKQTRPEKLTQSAELAARLGRGEYDQALHVLEAGVATRDYWAIEVMVNQVLSKGLAGQPRFEQLLARLRSTPARHAP